MNRKEKKAEKRQYHKDIIILSVIRCSEKISESCSVTLRQGYKDVMNMYDKLVEHCVKKDPENAHIIRGAAIDAKKELEKEINYDR